MPVLENHRLYAFMLELPLAARALRLWVRFMKGPMRTYCIFSTFYLPNLGGVEKYTANLAQALVRLGQKVFIVTSALEDNPGITEEDDVVLVRIPSRFFLHKRFATPRPSSELDELMTWLREQSIDYVLVNQRFYPTCIFGLRFAEQQRLPAITLDHGSAHLTIGNPFLDFFIKRYEHAITSIGKRHPSYYCAVSERSADWLHHFNLAPYAVLHNAIDADKFCRCSTQRDFRAELSIDNSSLLLAFTGRLLPEKGVLRLCAAVQELNSDGYDISVVIAGAGPAEQKLLAFCSDSIHFVGRLQEQEVSALLASADAFCFPTLYPEGFPTSLLEAAAQNLGIIVTDTAGARELMPTAEFGQIIPTGSVDDIKRAILRFHDDKKYLSQCGRNVGRRVRELFSWEQTAKTLMTTFDKMALPADNDR